MHFAVNAKEAWVDDALVFAEKLKDTPNTKAYRTLEQIKQELSALAPVKRLEAYQHIAFIYLTDWRLEEYQTLKVAYLSLLSQSGNDKHLDMQVVIDVLEASLSPEKLDEAIITIESLINSNVLLDEAHVLAHVVYVYSLNTKRNTPKTLKALRDAKNAYTLSKKSKFAELAVASASGFTALNAFDYAQNNKNTQTAYRIIQNIDYLYFNVDNYLSNLSYMLRQTNELQGAIRINNWQLAMLSDDSNKSIVFYTYFACGLYQQIYGDFERSLSCLMSAQKYLEYAPERWESWNAAVIISAILAERLDLANQYFSDFLTDSRADKELNPISKLRLAKAYLAIEKGESKEAIQALNAYHVYNASRQTSAFRRLSMEYNSFIDNEIKALEKNASLQQDLLHQQSILVAFGALIIVCLVTFTLFSLKSRKKQYILSRHDSLTTMFNRRGFLEVFAKALDKAKKDDTALALGLVDIDRFKAINEVNGHVVGDQVLKTIGKRLRDCLGAKAITGRMGGDELAFLLPNIQDNKELINVGDLLCKSLAKDIYISEIGLKLSVSIGFSSYPEAGGSTQQLVDCADFALNNCKAFERGSARIFSPSEQALLDKRRNLDVALINANEDEFSLQYQAIVDARTEQVIGFEALARWQSSSLGFVSPAVFIPAAERLSYINKLSRLLLTKALKEASRWPEHITLSFNLSSQDLNSIENAEKIKQIVLSSPFDSSRLIAEMTETAIIQDTNTTREALSLLTGIGVSVALDDFGTGYSSINHLLDLDFERIKLDRILIDSIENDRNKFEIVQTLVNLCHSLNIECVIEGVETNIQKQHLLKMKVDKFQGYYFSKPISPEQIPAFLAGKT